MLEQPSRLARLAADHLHLRPAHPTQIMTIADLPRRARSRARRAGSARGPAVGRRGGSASQAARRPRHRSWPWPRRCIVSRDIPTCLSPRRRLRVVGGVFVLALAILGLRLGDLALMSVDAATEEVAGRRRAGRARGAPTSSIATAICSRPTIPRPRCSPIRRRCSIRRPRRRGSRRILGLDRAWLLAQAGGAAPLRLAQAASHGGRAAERCSAWACPASAFAPNGIGSIRNAS